MVKPDIDINIDYDDNNFQNDDWDSDTENSNKSIKKENPYQCKICSKKLNSKISLKSHMRKHEKVI